MKRVITLAIMLLSALCANAQWSGDMHKRAVSIGLRPTLTGSPQFFYEHTLPKQFQICHGTAEGCIGWFGANQSITDQDAIGEQNLKGFQAKAAYKFNFPLRKGSMKVENGYLGSGLYIKPEVTFVARHRQYEAFVGNDGWEIHTQYKTYRDAAIAGMVLFGYQAVGDHVMWQIFFGYGHYLSRNVFNQGYYYGFGTMGNAGFKCTQLGMKLGILL